MLDSEGKKLEAVNYQLPFKSIPIALMVSKEKTLTVTPSYTNMWNTQIASVLKNSWKTETKTITIKGAPNVIDSITTIEYVNPIDLSQLSAAVGTKKTFELIPKLQDGVTISDAVDKVTFTYDLTKFAVKSFYITNFNHENTLKSGLKVSYDTGYSVTVCGLKSVINSISASDLYLALDLSDITSDSVGLKTVKAVLKSNKYNTVWMVGTCDVTVKISK